MKGRPDRDQAKTSQLAMGLLLLHQQPTVPLGTAFHAHEAVYTAITYKKPTLNSVSTEAPIRRLIKHCS